MALGIGNIASAARNRLPDQSAQEGLAQGSRPIGSLETRLAGVMVAAVKEAFDRDSRRLELERELMEAEHARAERALSLELRRQEGEREIGRLRLLAIVAIVSWLGSLFLAARIMSAGASQVGAHSAAARAALGAGSALLLAALAATFAAQSRVGQDLHRMADTISRDAVSSGPAGALAPWLVIAGLAAIGLAVLIA